VHVLVIPTGPYESLSAFTLHASAAEIAGYFQAVGKVAQQLGLTEPGFRALSNEGENGRQEVPHLHFHLFGGKRLGAMLGE
jgi:diadenosine tetraphosphate (Ap4A) HIT family hydrolase